jgi:hypothetical protein
MHDVQDGGSGDSLAAVFLATSRGSDNHTFIDSHEPITA